MSKGHTEGGAEKKHMRRAVATASVAAWSLMAVAAEEAGPPRHWCGVSAAHQPRITAGDSGASSFIPLPQADPAITYEITILFFYTRGFADDFRDDGHMEAEIAASVDLLNRALANSHVNARFRTVGIERHPAMPTRQNSAMDWINDSPIARERRSEAGADLVYALVDDPAGYFGVACQPGAFRRTTGEECFWGSVNSWSPYVRPFDNENIWQTVLRHEVGHNLGIQHSPEFGGDPGGGFYPGAVGYTVTSHDPWFGTVMGGNELPRFSTSSERFNFREHRNLVVGEPGVHEASAALLYSIGPVSRYRAAAPPSFAARTTISDQRWVEGEVIEPLVLPLAVGGDRGSDVLPQARSAPGS